MPRIRRSGEVDGNPSLIRTTAENYRHKIYPSADSGTRLLRAGMNVFTWHERRPGMLKALEKHSTLAD